MLFPSFGRGIRRFAKRAKAGRSSDSPLADELPELRTTMRRLAFLVHPDRFPDTPDAAAVNASSLSYLQGLLSTVQKARDSHPPASVQRLKFHLRDGEQRVRLVEHTVRTTGGDCRAVVQRSLGELFTKCGLPADFRWGTGDWELLSKDALAERDNRGPESSAAAEEPAPQSSPAVPPAFNTEAVARPQQPPGDAQGLAEALERLDPMLEALAAVPWLPLSAAGAERRHYLTHHVLGTLRADGWRIERGVFRIWSGERDEGTLCADEFAAGTDAASAQALTVVLAHTRKFEAELGSPQQAVTVTGGQQS